MAKTYQWRAYTDYRSDTTLSYGTNSSYTSWQTSQSGSSETLDHTTYWYRDSNTAWQGTFQDALSSRVSIVITQSWTTSIDDSNNLTVTVTTTLNGINRDDIQHPSGYYDSDTPGRDIDIYKQEGGTAVWSGTDNQVATAHTIVSGPLNFGSETFTIAPGDSTVVRPSLYLHNEAVGGTSYDDVWIGVQFRNPLPKDYRPGEVLTSGAWKSTDRTGGKCHLLSNGSWVEMRTNDGGTGTGNPPSRRTSGAWKNQYKIGTT